jgi:hypothetical protein
MQASPQPPQAEEEDEDIPARKKPRVEEPLPATTDEAARKTALLDLSAGLPTPDTPPSTDTVNASTRRQSRHQIQLPPMEPSETQLNDVVSLSGPVLPPLATMSLSTRRRSSRRVIPTRSTSIPVPPPTTATVEASTRRRSRQQTQLPPTETSETQRNYVSDMSGPVPPPPAVDVSTCRRSSRRVIPTSSTGTPVPPPTATVNTLTRRRSRRQTQLPRIEMCETQLDG